jgi:glyoxylase-like metal-dependent hydrolase (beta-lactamase superfamily II)
MPKQDDATVVAVHYGDLHTTRSHVFLNYEDLGEPDAPHTLAYYFWVIFTGEATVVVDTGFEASVGERRGRSVRITPPEAFAALGIHPEDPVDVVVTHAHYDHIGNLNYIRNATVHVSAAEEEFWNSEASRQPMVQPLTEPDELEHLRSLRAEGRIVPAREGDEIAPGVHILDAAGHTPGQLMVLTDSGVLLTSDAVHFDEERRRRIPFRHMTDLVGADRAFRRINAMEENGTVVIPGHDDRIHRDFPPLPGPLREHAVLIAGKAPNA